MGSSRAAFMAGQRPKNRPMLVATTKPATTDQSGTVDGRLGTKSRIIKLSSQPTAIPDQPARAGEHDGFQQELPGDVAPARADGLAHANLPRALRDRDQHDVHYADAPHQQADGGDHHHHQRHGADNLRETRR